MSFVTWVVITAALVLLFAFVLLSGILRRSLNTVILSVVILLFAACAGGIAVYRFMKEAYQEYKHDINPPKTNPA